MAYSKTAWTDRAVQYPSRFTRTNDGTYDTLTPAPGTITNSGTPITASSLNNLETQYDQAVSYINGVRMLAKDQFNSTEPPTSYPIGTSVMEVTTATGFNFQYGTVTTSYNNVNRCYQLAVEKSSGKTWIRTGDSAQTNSWSAWAQIYNSTDFTKSNSQNGYQKLPSGIIVQWGRFNPGGTSGSQVPFPVAFTSNVLSITASLLDSNVGSSGGYAFVTGSNANNFWLRSTASFVVSWIAIGV